MRALKIIQFVGVNFVVLGLLIFCTLVVVGPFQLSEKTIKETLSKKQFNNIGQQLIDEVAGKEFDNSIGLSLAITSVYDAKNDALQKVKEWDQVMHDKPHNFALPLVSAANKSDVAQNQWLGFLLTFGLAILGGLMNILPMFKVWGKAGIKHNGIYHNNITNRGWIAWLTFGFLVGFYILLYFYPDFIVNWVVLVNPISLAISGNPASQWFLYGFIYTTIMTVMGLRMYVKYRHNLYQMVRTTSVIFFQIAFAFIIPEILVRFNQPYMDFKNAWPLDYDFFFDWNINSLIENGTVGIFMLCWGIFLTLILVPVFTYFYGKRWYCSWVCGCGGLAETLGDPYRQHSDKSLKAWQVERWLVHGVLVFAVIMTAATLYTFFSGASKIWFISSYDLQYWYGFLIGSIFAGVIGTGFYPIFGNRVWCRFGCPLAAYLGVVQRFKSRFRITTNGGQCISCGNCSTYCEQGIDVRAYAQKGQNIVRASCVGCGVCAAVCPRGVLKLENGPEIGRITDDPVEVGIDQKL